MPRLLVSAAHKSSGKTTISLGLCAAFAQRGLQVQAFKKGPDYIDPLWLGVATGRPCYNLDFHTQGHDEIETLFRRLSAPADFALIEGNKGLYDGLDLDGSNSNAALAALLKTPVLLVIDCQGMTRGVAPLVLGYQNFEPTVEIAAVILNKVGGPRHESKLRAVLAHYTDVPVVGAVQRDPSLEIRERHLGLVPSNETSAARAKIGAIANLIADQVDLDRVLAVGSTPPPLPTQALSDPAITDPGHARYPAQRSELRIGVARDAAFAFYYPDDLDAMGAAGAEIKFFDTLTDTRLPDVDALFLGGGFPETQIAALSANTALRQEIHTAIEAGMPVYAECGGLMYLSRGIQWGEQRAEMVGIIPALAVMHDRPVGRGYARLRETAHYLWSPVKDCEVGGQRAVHEFHHSALEWLPAEAKAEQGPEHRFAFEVLRGTGIDRRHDGFVYRNLMACYTHQRHTRANPWVDQFIAFIRAHKAREHQSTA